MPSPPLGIQCQGDSPNRAGKRLPPSSTRLFSSEGWSLNNYRVHWLVHRPAIRKKKTVWGCQHLEYCAFRAFVLFFFSENQMGMCRWVRSPKRTHRGHLWERLELLLEEHSSSFSPVIKTFISGRNSFCWGNCSRFQFLIYVVIFEKHPFETVTCWERFIHQIKNCLYELSWIFSTFIWIPLENTVMEQHFYLRWIGGTYYGVGQSLFLQRWNG